MSLEEIKQRKLEELQSQMQEEEQSQKNLRAIENLAKQYLTKEALLRFGNIKAAHPEKAHQLSVLIAQMAQSGQLKEKLTDNLLKDILIRLTQKKEINIRRK